MLHVCGSYTKRTHLLPGLGPFFQNKSFDTISSYLVARPNLDLATVADDYDLERHAPFLTTCLR